MNDHVELPKFVLKVANGSWHRLHWSFPFKARNSDGFSNGYFSFSTSLQLSDSGLPNCALYICWSLLCTPVSVIRLCADNGKAYFSDDAIRDNSDTVASCIFFPKDGFRIVFIRDNLAYQ